MKINRIVRKLQLELDLDWLTSEGKVLCQKSNFPDFFDLKTEVSLRRIDAFFSQNVIDKPIHPSLGLQAKAFMLLGLN